MAATYQVELERDDTGWWVAHVPSVAGAHTQGRSIAQAMNRIREALALWVADANRAELVPVFHLPTAARYKVQRVLATRERADRVEQEAAIVLRETIRELTKREKLSTRDVAALLEVSPSRVDQLKPAASAQYRVAGAAPRVASAKKKAARRRSVAKHATRR